MNDMISKQQAVNALYEWEFDNKDDRDAIDVINGLPPIQPEIVRCKDCQHYEYGICKKAGLCVNKSQNGFCDWAEKREVNHESN